ncbi:MAG: RNA polymerase sigma factor [Candidatus Wildermuthbacteria bacterium]|nr:RNA polymerase sigma factor [Candidatus Wildermuthbacteria bacterium]
MRDEFIKAYDTYANAIFRHCYFRLFDRELANDLVQETFIHTWRYIIAGKEIKNIRAFLYRVANNLVIDYSRKKKTVSLDRLQEKGYDPSLDVRDKIGWVIDAKSIVQNLVQLEEKYRDVILMRYIDELSPKEIAEILQESENAISVRIHRGVQKLKEVIGQHQEYGLSKAL